ncbi:hypothetical protein K491DRAFT_264508 [Lophiostoma macrostomum CBS 122681]|uniref:Uncharacterized protein n=1 Tax=Lophiostoma macrostomum CBS 122681 TaxID=1314788 RepID=A0A6A6SM34_9PLEO|nr:hypothetical protein K491DRAFT_264508 [Lophiostoma macrostomum CBS 122681]
MWVAVLVFSSHDLFVLHLLLPYLSIFSLYDARLGRILVAINRRRSTIHIRGVITNRVPALNPPLRACAFPWSTVSEDVYTGRPSVMSSPSAGLDV